MRNYELTVILPGGTTAAKKKSTQVKIEKMVKTLKGKTGRVEDWGERELAYAINKKNTGIFLHFRLELEASAAQTIAGKLKLEEEIIRYLLIKKQ